MENKTDDKIRVPIVEDSNEIDSDNGNFHYHCNMEIKPPTHERCEVESCDKPDKCTFDEAMSLCICAVDCWRHEWNKDDRQFHYHCYNDFEDGDLCMGCEIDDCCECEYCKFTPCYKEECGECDGDVDTNDYLEDNDDE